jgi:hypothetical protein
MNHEKECHEKEQDMREINTQNPTIISVLILFGRGGLD